MTIRAVRAHELERLREIERAAGEVFRTIGMDAIADDEPPVVEELEEYRAAGRAWVAVDDADMPIAYVIVDVLDGAAHVEQVSVHPDHARQGLGRRLLDHVAQWARARGLDAMTLTSFRDVAWNAPYYERCGFIVLAEDDVGPELQARRDDETAHGLDPDRRVCMRRSLD
jgi:GNAT superfamily N-acetyltransferase